MRVTDTERDKLNHICQTLVDLTMAPWHTRQSELRHLTRIARAATAVRAFANELQFAERHSTARGSGRKVGALTAGRRDRLWSSIEMLHVRLELRGDSHAAALAELQELELTLLDVLATTRNLIHELERKYAR